MVGSVRCARSSILGSVVVAISAFVFSATCRVSKAQGEGRSGAKFGVLQADSEPESILATPSTVSFDGVPVGEQYTQTVRLTNVTHASLKVTKILASSPEFTISAVALPTPLEPSGELAFTVAYRPKSAEKTRGRIDIQTSSTGNASVELRASAVQNEVELTANVASLDFDEVPVGQFSKKEVLLSNAGNAKLAISKVVLFGENFDIAGDGTLSLAPGQTTKLEIGFHPKGGGTSNGTISIFSNSPDSPLQIPLSANGFAPSTQGISLRWNGSEEAVIGYFVYRSSQNGGPYTKLQDAVLSSAEFTDSGLASGRTYYYVVTSVDGNNVESNYSDQIIVAVPEE